MRFAPSPAAGSFFCALAAASGLASAQIQSGSFPIRLEPVASGLVSPVQAKAPPDGTNRLFVVDQSGVVRIIENGVLLAAPFLDVRSLIVTLNAGFDERGLLGLAFAPDYATSGRFFVHYTVSRPGEPGDPCLGTSRGCSTEVLAEFRVSDADPNLADPDSRVVLLSVPKPQFNHCGGFIDFGPDGFLYMSLGDGGGANDGLADNPPSHGPTGNAQNLGTPLGKMLRFDVSSPGILAFPPDNPFLNTPGAYPGVYAFGLRNPYSATFDDGPGGTGRLFIGDVGQNLFEEVDILRAGGNYGWPIREGLHCFNPFAPTMPPLACAGGFVDPIAEYTRTEGISVISGGVYRGSAIPALHGLYVFGDFSTAFNQPRGNLFFLAPPPPEVMDPAPVSFQRLRIGSNDQPLGLFLKGFGRDRHHEIYVLGSTVLGPTGAAGVVLRIAPCPGDFNRDGPINADDLGDFINCYFAVPPCADADFNADGTVDADDLGDFINTYFGGC
ncbi:MAG: PQQ-dependent sugar dehydrogenase [Phycisphaerales bacterium]